MAKLLDGTVDLVWLFADQAKIYADACFKDNSQQWDCRLWDKFGKPNGFAYIHTGMYDYTMNGTTLVASKKGSGVPEIVNPGIRKFMKTKEYYDICKKYNLVQQCYSNEHFPSSSDKKTPKQAWELPTNKIITKCTDGYCPCIPFK